MRGRVMALYMAIFAGGTPIGAPVVGWVANVDGPRWALGVAAASGLLAAAVALTWMIVAKHLRVRVDREARFGLTVNYDVRGARVVRRPTREDLGTQEIAIQRG